MTTPPRKILVVCTGNVARSPALELLLRHYRPDLQVRSAAVGPHSKDGRRMALPMRRRMVELELGAEAEAHRSRTLATAFQEDGRPDLILATAPVHLQRLGANELVGSTPVQLLNPPISDPAFGGEPAYDRALTQLLRAVGHLAMEL